MKIILNNIKQDNKTEYYSKTLKENQGLMNNDIKEFMTDLINQINNPQTTYKNISNDLITFTPNNHLLPLSLVRDKKNKLQLFDSQYNKKTTLDIDFDWFLDQFNNDNPYIYKFNISRYIYKKMMELNIDYKSQYYIVADFDIIKEYINYTACVLIKINMNDYVFLNNKSLSPDSIKIVVEINYLHPYYLKIYIKNNRFSYTINDKKWKKAFNRKLNTHQKQIKKKYQNPIEIFLSKNKK